MASRLMDIDKLRAIAALSVLYFHATNTVLNYPTNELIRTSGAFGHLGVDVFFVISGFIIPLFMWRANFVFTQHWKTFIAKRIVRIEPSCIASIAFTILLGYIVNAYYDKVLYQYTIYQLLSHLFYLNIILGYDWVNPVYWTLAIEFQFYIFLLFVYHSIVNKKFRWLAYMCILTSAHYLNNSVFIFKFLPIFFVGISAFLYHTQLIKLFEYIGLVIISCIFAATSVGFISVLVGLITAHAILFINLPNSKFLVMLGSISYSTYLFQYPIVEKIVRFGKVLGYTVYSQLFIVTLSIIDSIFISYIMYVLVERPSMCVAAKFKYK